MHRRFFVKAGGALVAAGAAAVVDAPNVIAQPRVQWRMPTMWPPALDILQGNAQKFARIVDELTAGRVKIQVFASGELMPATGVFDACLQGTVEAFNGAAYYWAGKENGLQWFTSVPFGLNTQGYMAWYQQGDGLTLWEEAYAPFGVVPRPGQSTNPQMGGWFRKKINTVDDVKGLKIRIPGLAGKVYAKAGAAVVSCPRARSTPRWSAAPSTPPSSSDRTTTSSSASRTPPGTTTTRAGKRPRRSPSSASTRRRTTPCPSTPGARWTTRPP